MSKHAPVENVPALFVYKESSHYNFTGECSREQVFYYTSRVLHQFVLFVTRRTRSGRCREGERDSVQVGERGTFPDVSEGDQGKYKSIVLDE